MGVVSGQSSTFHLYSWAPFCCWFRIFFTTNSCFNPFAISLGDESTGSHRLNLAGGINSFGTAIGPIVVSLALFGTAASVNIDLDALIDNKEITLISVQYLYVFVGVLFLLLLQFFIFLRHTTR